MQLELAGLDLGHVQHAVDQLQQMAAGFMDQPRNIPDSAAIAQAAENLPRHHFRETDDGVERRAQLMAHIGEEGGFGAGRAHRGVARLDQGPLLDFAFGDVARHRHDLGRGARPERRGRQRISAQTYAFSPWRSRASAAPSRPK